jgi:hypothetical protein
LANAQWLPTMQSCAMCEEAMKRLSSPTVVTPLSLVVRAIDRHVLAKGVALADHHPRRLAGGLLVLRRIADRGELEHPVVGAERRVSR